MKGILSKTLAVAIVLMMALVPVSVMIVPSGASSDSNADPTPGLNYTYNTDGTATLTSWDGRDNALYKNSVIIPSSVTKDGKSYNVVAIGDGVFKNCYTLVSVTIPSTVKSIGKEAFYGCCYMYEVPKMDNVTVIGDSAFYGCLKATITIPSGVVTIGDFAFYSCGSGSGWSTEITIPKSVTSIGDGAFGKCLLSKITVDSSNTNYKMIDDGKKLVSMDGVMITAMSASDTETFTGIKKIGSCAFNGTTLNTVLIPSNVKEIGSEAFAGCTNLSSVTIAEGVEKIGFGAFNNTSITTVEIPKTVKTITGNPFGGCNSLIEIKVASGGNNYKTIANDHVLISCDGKTLVAWISNGTTTVTIPSTVEIIAPYAFSHCTGMTSVVIQDNVVTIGDGAFDSCEELTSIIIPEGVTTLGSGMFNSCKKLKTIEIPSTVSSIGDGFIVDCWTLDKITISKENKVYTDVDGVVYDKGMTELIFTPEHYRELVIPEGVSKIRFGSILNSSNSKVEGKGMKSVYFPTSITSISRDLVKNFTLTKSNDDPIKDYTEIIGKGFYYMSTKGGHLIEWDAKVNVPAKTVTVSSVTITGKIESKFDVKVNGVTVASEIPAGDFSCKLELQPGNNMITFSGYMHENTHPSKIVQVYYYLEKNVTADIYHNEGGTVTGSGNYEYGSEVTVTATPAEGYHFSHWSDGSTDAVHKFILTENTVITAVFEKDPVEAGESFWDTPGAIVGVCILVLILILLIVLLVRYEYWRLKQ